MIDDRRDTAALCQHLRRRYGIAAELERISRGRAENFLVRGSDERWLLKIFQSDYSLARIERAADFVRFIVRQGYPAREFVATLDGAPAVMVGRHVAVLIPWIDGDTPEPNTLTSPDELRQLGALCGWIHRLGASYDAADALEFVGSTTTISEKQATLARVASAAPNHEIADEVAVRLRILTRWGEALAAAPRNATRGIIHGDFSGAHVVFQGERAAGVIDILGEKYLPGWELMRAFFQSVPCGDDVPPAALEAPWRAYLGGYTAERPVQAQDIGVAYDVYLLQLAASTYGLRRPLDAELRAFGRWRTRLAAYLSEHRALLRQVLIDCVPG